MLSQTFHYSVASVVSAAIGLLSAVVFTRLLTPEEYGVYVVGLSTAGIVSALLFTWVRVSALRFQSEGGAVDVRKTIFVAYLISALAAPRRTPRCHTDDVGIAGAKSRGDLFRAGARPV